MSAANLSPALVCSASNSKGRGTATHGDFSVEYCPGDARPIEVLDLL